MRPLPRTHVASGDYRVAKTRREYLEAYLGTCVGVAIVDRRAQVGGLLHILLPEAVSAGLAFGSALCARTSIPLFLDELRAAGCSPESMEATVAGGALVGSVTSLDLDLDIGGRTVDVVDAMLKDAAVRVVCSETGGHFGSRLALDLETLTCEIEPMAVDVSAVGVRPQRLTADELDLATARIRPIPQAALKIIRMLQIDDYSLHEIAQEIRRDQVLTAKVIRTCNSAYLGAREEIKSIDRALVLLGGRLVGELILSTVMGTFFSSYQRGYSMSRGGLYHHAVSTAIVSEQLAMLTGAAQRDLAYTAGLLHDIGKVLLDQYVASARPLFYREVVAEGAELLDVERSVLGVSHEEAGARLAELWSFPAVLWNVIAHHTRPAEAEGDKTLPYLVYLANLLVSRFDAGHDLDRMGTSDLADALRHLGLEAGSLPELIGRIRWADLQAPGYS
ncbi:MAG TPA: HDOD domain-containing protein [Vicinamibacterales bacterium]|jgi:putative nucleotidyltransferase with HDIG domain